MTRRERFSKLTYTGARKLSRMPPRSAVVAFSAEDVYAIAELIRRQRGGAAVVMGSLSPRTRNAQVALYQSGEVDYLVATDAIGMGLNIDIEPRRLRRPRKFDGRRHRHLSANELAQIAGRAGRYSTDGTFGVTGEARRSSPSWSRRSRATASGRSSGCSGATARSTSARPSGWSLASRRRPTTRTCSGRARPTTSRR